MALDATGIPHVTYLDQSRTIVEYAVRRNGSWRVEPVDRLVRAAFPDRNSITLDENGPYIGYYDAGRAVLKVARRQDAGWVSEIVDSDGAGYTSSMQIRDGVIWISYADETNHALKVARRTIIQSSAVSTDARGTRKTGAGGAKLP
jgi:hypothetical protein